MLFERAEKIGVYLSPKNVNNAHEDLLTALKADAYDLIIGPEGSNLKKELAENDVLIINAHADFYYNVGYDIAFDPAYFPDLKPDMYVTFIDGSTEIFGRIGKRDQWKYQNLTSKDILLWQNVEVNDTKLVARIFRKPHYVITSGQPLSTLFNLVFYPEVEKVYVSMPITHLRSKEDQIKILKFINELNKYFVVFNPLTVDMGTAAGEEKLKIKGFIIESAEHEQTVRRDMKWQLAQSDKNIVYFPRVLASPGVTDERLLAYLGTKDVFVVHPAEASPFIKKFNTVSRLFYEPEDLFQFLQEDYFNKILPNFLYSMETYENYSEQ